MQHNAKSIRTFIGAKNFEESRQFYQDLGFEEVRIFYNMSYIRISDKLGFYLQDAYVADWVNNSMIFLEVDDVDRYWKELQELGLERKYPQARLTAVKEENWGKECFLHDPAGILWHFGQFSEMK